MGILQPVSREEKLIKKSPTDWTIFVSFGAEARRCAVQESGNLPDCVASLFRADCGG
jgi:hypothetical protein